MPSFLLEIVELSAGEFALRRSSPKEKNKDKPLISIKFSEETMGFIDGTGAEFAKVMIDAGIRAFQEVAEKRFAESEGPEPGEPIH